MSRRTANGIQSILDGILSPENRQPSTSPQPPSAGTTGPRATPADKTGEGQRPPTGARRGRPLGKAQDAAQPKTKVTLWLSTGIVTAYRDWSWEARSQFSHLVERALNEFHRSRRNSPPTPR